MKNLFVVLLLSLVSICTSLNEYNHIINNDNESNGGDKGVIYPPHPIRPKKLI